MRLWSSWYRMMQRGILGREFNEERIQRGEDPELNWQRI